MIDFELIKQNCLFSDWMRNYLPSCTCCEAIGKTIPITKTIYKDIDDFIVSEMINIHSKLKNIDLLPIYHCEDGYYQVCSRKTINNIWDTIPKNMPPNIFKKNFGSFVINELVPEDKILSRPMGHGIYSHIYIIVNKCDVEVLFNY